jgi:hypothetical protein
MPSSNKPDPLSDEAWVERLGKIKALEDAKAKKGIVSPDYAALSAAAMNRHTTSPEFTARYKKWLEYLGPDLLTPLAKADYEQILAEEAAAKQTEAKSKPP